MIATVCHDVDLYIYLTWKLENILKFKSWEPSVKNAKQQSEFNTSNNITCEIPNHKTITITMHADEYCSGAPEVYLTWLNNSHRGKLCKKRTGLIVLNNTLLKIMEYLTTISTTLE